MTPEERRPADAETEQAKSKHLKEESCAICLEPISPRPQIAEHFPAPTLPTFRAPKDIGYSALNKCVSCAGLSFLRNRKTIEEGYRLYILLRKLVERSGSSWSRLTANQTRTMMDKTIRS